MPLAPPIRPYVLAIISSIMVIGQAQGAGFAIYEQSTTGLGTAFAGSAVVAEDASTIFFNPAGMVHLPGNNAVISVSPIFPSAEYSDDGSRTFNPFFNPAPPPDNGPSTFPTSGLTTVNGGTPAVAGATYLSHQLSDDAWFGVGLNAPFGLTTEYDPDWVGRYNAVKSQLLTFNLNAAMAFKPIFFVFSKPDLHGLTPDEIKENFERCMAVPLAQLRKKLINVRHYNVQCAGWGMDSELQKLGIDVLLSDLVHAMGAASEEA